MVACSLAGNRLATRSGHESAVYAQFSAPRAILGARGGLRDRWSGPGAHLRGSAALRRHGLHYQRLRQRQRHRVQRWQRPWQSAEGPDLHRQVAHVQAQQPGDRRGDAHSSAGRRRRDARDGACRASTRSPSEHHLRARAAMLPALHHRLTATPRLPYRCSLGLITAAGRGSEGAEPGQAASEAQHCRLYQHWRRSRPEITPLDGLRWACVGACPTYNPLGSTATFLSEADILVAARRLLRSQRGSGGV